MAGYPGTHGGHANVGRKRKSLNEHVLNGTVTLDQRAQHAEQQREQRAQAGDDVSATSAAPIADYVPKPHGLTRQESRVWDELAPLALAAHTLTPQTSVGFRTLVETRATRLALRRKIQREGFIATKGPHKGKRHPLMVEHRNLLTLETTAMLRFCLHAAGRQMDFVEPLPTASPEQAASGDRWSKFDTPPPVNPDGLAGTLEADKPTRAH